MVPAFVPTPLDAIKADASVTALGTVLEASAFTLLCAELRAAE